ncbi:MAG: ABC transporter permease [Deltaproteobacteria bacterium]|nr:ABC transporter permease [Deltaproteobacteria bacterium]
MKFWDLYLAKKYLRSPSKRGIRLVLRLAILGLALGVATLTLTQAVLGGFEKVFRESILGFNAHLVVMKEGEMKDPAAEEKEISRVLGGEFVVGTPFLYREVLMVAHGRVKGAVFKGIDPLTFARVYAVKTRPLGGTQVPAKIEDLLRTPGNLPTVVLGADLAQELGIEGSEETLKIFLPKKSSAKGVEKDFQTFRVAGTFTTGLYEFDHGFAFVDIQRMQEILGNAGVATGIEMLLRHPLEADARAAELKSALGREYEAVSWQRLNGPLFSALKKERVMFLLIMATVVAVASFNIVGVLLLMIFDRGREISILRAIGASNGAVQRLFAYQGLAIGVLGAGFGIALGIAIAWLVRSSGPGNRPCSIFWALWINRRRGE